MPQNSYDYMLQKLRAQGARPTSVQYPGGQPLDPSFVPPAPRDYPPTPTLEYYGRDEQPGIDLPTIAPDLPTPHEYFNADWLKNLPANTVPSQADAVSTGDSPVAELVGGAPVPQMDILAEQIPLPNEPMSMGQTPTADMFQAAPPPPEPATELGMPLNRPPEDLNIPPLEVEPAAPTPEPPRSPSIRQNVRDFLASKRFQRFSEGAGAALGKVGRGLSGIRGGRIEAEPPTPSPYAVDAEDRIPQEMVDALGRMGIPVDPDIGMSRLKTMMPLLSQQLSRTAADPLDQMLKLERLQNYGDLRQARETRLARLPQPIANSIMNKNSIYKAIQEIRRRWQEISPDQDSKVDPVRSAWSKLQKGIKYYGVGDPRLAALQAELGSAFANYVHDISGAQVGREEFARLAQNIPQVEFSPAVFQEVLDAWEQRVTREFHNTLDTYEKMPGYADTVQAFREDMPNPLAGETPQGSANPAGAVRLPRHGGPEVGRVHMDLKRAGIPVEFYDEMELEDLE